MAKFCTQCGKPLAEGETCTCQQQRQGGGNLPQMNPHVNPNPFQFPGNNQKETHQETGQTGNGQNRNEYGRSSGYETGAGGNGQRQTGFERNNGFGIGPIGNNQRQNGFERNGQFGPGTGGNGQRNGQFGPGTGGNGQRNGQFGSGPAGNTPGYDGNNPYRPGNGRADGFGNAFHRNNQGNINRDPGLLEDRIKFEKLLGLNDSSYTTKKDCYEYGKRIVPDIVSPVESETPVKQYHICNARSRISGLWQEGRMQVTDKRVLFRMSGRNWLGKVVDHAEFNLDEVAGIAVNRGVAFSFKDFAFMGVLTAFAASLFGTLIVELSTFLSFVFMIIFVAGPIFLFVVYHSRLYFIMSLGFGLAAAISYNLVLDTLSNYYRHGGGTIDARVYGVFAFFLMIIAIVFLFLAALKPKMNIAVMTKCASDKPVQILSGKWTRVFAEILPTEDTDTAVRELGAMIRDIQNLGEEGVKKWQVK